VLHIVGDGAFALAAQLFRHAKGARPTPDAHRLVYGHIVDDGEVVDEVLLRLVPPADAPGGQPLVEVNCHGGLVAVQRVLECFVRHGAQAVEPNAMLGLHTPTRIAAEASRALANAPTPLGVDTLLDQLDGALERGLAALPLDEPADTAAALRHLLATAPLGQALWQPPSVTLAGPANAGKSTLLNALAREDRMIVSPTPGTTRDTVTAEVALGGVPVWLTDTAGDRPPGSAIEQHAIARARAAAADADLVLLVLDAASPLPAPLDHLHAAVPTPHLLVLNKTDLPHASWTQDAPDALHISASTGNGLPLLVHRLVGMLVGEATYTQGRPVVFTARQADLLRRALAAAESDDTAAARRHIAQIT